MDDTTENKDTENDNIVFFNETQAETIVQKPKKKIWVHILVVLVIIFFATLVGINTIYNNKTFSQYKVIAQAPRSDTSEIQYMPFSTSLIKYGKDGIAYVNSNGEDIWNEAYSMKSPMAVVNGDYIAIGDIGANDLYIFGLKGKYTNFATPYPIASLEISKKGMVTVVLQDSTTNYIQMYDKMGTYYYVVKTSIEQHGQPLDVDISDDGTKLVVSYIMLDGVKFKDSIAFYDFSSVGQNESERLMGAYEFDEIVFPKVEFLGNDIVCAYGEDRAILYHMKHIPSVITEIKFDTEIKSIFSNEEYVGFVCRNLDSETDKKYQIKIYSNSGKEILVKNIDFEYNKIRTSKDEFIIIGDFECTIYTFAGKQKFYCNFGKNIIDIIPNGKKNEYIVLDEVSAQVICLY